MKKYRVWWGKESYACEDVEAETAEDALLISNINFQKFGHKVERVEALISMTHRQEGRKNNVVNQTRRIQCLKTNSHPKNTTRSWSVN